MGWRDQGGRREAHGNATAVMQAREERSWAQHLRGGGEEMCLWAELTGLHLLRDLMWGVGKGGTSADYQVSRGATVSYAAIGRKGKAEGRAGLCLVLLCSQGRSN